MESKNVKVLAVSVAVALLAGAAIGRFTVPAKVVTKVETKIEQVEVVKWKEKSTSNTTKDKEVVIVETRLPDGTVRKETRIIDKGRIVVDVSKDSEKKSESSVVSSSQTTRDSGNKDWQLSLLATSSHLEDPLLLTGGAAYGVHVQRRILGPFSVGVFGITNKTYGASLGVTW